MTIIGTNVAAMRTNRAANNAEMSLAQSIERLSVSTAPAMMLPVLLSPPG